MTEILKSDVFFFISSIAVIILTIILMIASFYLIKILRNFSDISIILKEAALDAEESFSEILQTVRRNTFLNFIVRKIFGRR